MDGSAVFSAKTLGATRGARRLGQAAGRLREAMLQGMREVSPDIIAEFERQAPYDADERDSYHMRDHIESHVEDLGRAQLTVTVEAISPESGYDYLDVTRRGHKGAISVKQQKRLKWKDAEGTHFAVTTKGHHPASDWTEQAHDNVADHIAEPLANRVGRIISTRVIR